MTSSSGSVLVVDDNEMNRDMLRRRLERQGYTVGTAADGEQALERIEKESWDLVLLDVTMPGLSGLDVLREIRSQKGPNELPVIMVTARQDSPDIVRALEQGANDYVTKPIDFPVALARIRTQLSRKQTENALRESEERYALAFRGANDGLWDWDLKSNEMHFSPRWKSMLGWEDHEIANIPEEWFRRVHPEDRVKLEETIASHLAGQTPHFEREHRMLHKDGAYRWMLSRGLAVRDTAGTATRMAGSQTDITWGKTSDALTGLPNRVLFLDRLDRSLQRSKRRKDFLFAVIFLDLDRFELVNDSLGHVIGDQLLIETAERLETSLRSIDTVARSGENTAARVGGDEFILLLEDIKHISDAMRVAERISVELSKPFSMNGQEVVVTASMGIALSATGYDHPEDLLRDAGTAMNRAKSLGKARFEVFDPQMREQTISRLQLEMDLRRALEQREFENFYQPIISLSTGQIVGFEALVRWNHPKRGLVYPMEFIPIAEETNLIFPLGQWVLTEACRQMRIWLERFGAGRSLSISVNLSTKQFLQPDLIEQIGGILFATGLPPSSLKLEITESMIMGDPYSAAATLSQIKALDIQLGIDDFGTGYSSLSYLHRFPVDTMKVDRSFVSQMELKEENKQIVGTIVALAHNLGLDVVAEGVETVEQLGQLKQLGCEYGQGYLFSKAVKREDAEQLLASDTRWRSEDLQPVVKLSPAVDSNA
ncbi:MAG TPA: EAL domain-containing protein [Terriglobia bacterium]|nr:EAL domain-containing protein [Terriglobia bacterium]